MKFSYGGLLIHLYHSNSVLLWRQKERTQKRELSPNMVLSQLREREREREREKGKGWSLEVGLHFCSGGWWGVRERRVKASAYLCTSKSTTEPHSEPKPKKEDAFFTRNWPGGVMWWPFCFICLFIYLFEILLISAFFCDDYLHFSL